MMKKIIINLTCFAIVLFSISLFQYDIPIIKIVCLLGDAALIGIYNTFVPDDNKK